MLDRLAILALVLVGGWTVFSLVQADSHPVLPSGHVVPIVLRGLARDAASGQGHLIWYRHGQLLVVSLYLEGLPANTPATARLVPEATCSAKGGGRLLATAVTNRRGQVNLNAELQGVYSLQYATNSISVSSGDSGSVVKACGEIGLSGAAQLSP